MSSIIRAMKQSFIRYPLQEIFRAASHVAILRVLNQLTGGISGRELARRAEINDRTCRLSLKRLEYLNVIEYLGSGKTKLVRLNRQSFFTKSIISGLFEAERDYLKSVVIDDKLDVCDQLETQMQHVVDSYQCEWKTTIGDESKLKRFRHFVNSDKHDENIVFVEERGQIRPANLEERELLVVENA